MSEVSKDGLLSDGSYVMVERYPQLDEKWVLIDSAEFRPPQDVVARWQLVDEATRRALEVQEQQRALERRHQLGLQKIKLQQFQQSHAVLKKEKGGEDGGDEEEVMSSSVVVVDVSQLSSGVEMPNQSQLETSQDLVDVLDAAKRLEEDSFTSRETRKKKEEQLSLEMLRNERGAPFYTSTEVLSSRNCPCIGAQVGVHRKDCPNCGLKPQV